VKSENIEIIRRLISGMCLRAFGLFDGNISKKIPVAMTFNFGSQLKCQTTAN
jgi:hypothetical protein